MGRYSPTVLPQAYPSPFLSALGGVAEGAYGFFSGRDALRERQRERELQELQLAQQGIRRTDQYQDPRQTRARSVVAEELSPNLAAAAGAGGAVGGPAGAAMGAMDATRAAIDRAAPQIVPPQAAPMQDAPQPRPAGPTGHMAFGALASELGGGAQAPAAAAPMGGRQSLSGYLGYEDRPAAMRPYEVGRYTVDPMVPFDRTRAAARLERQDAREEQEQDRTTLRGQLAGVTLTDPAANALMRAGRVEEAVRLQQLADINRRELEIERGRMSREEERSVRAEATQRLQFAIADMRRDVALRGQDLTTWRATVGALVDLATEVSSQGTAETPAQRVQRQQLEAARDALAAKAGLPTRRTPQR